ncbi:MAG: type II toxin-antitoxin system death-on-curing family toxin [Planctomycetes bacterium]|nr:type II toxin-antitoxin system death-on-curing family toxin [Planctomycetota bacterium]
MIYGALPREPRFLTIDEVLTLHQAVMDEFGGLGGVRDRALFESAVAMPRQGAFGQFAHGIPFGMAAAYAFHLSKNHPFVDGNKRVAFAACVAFLGLNGWELSAPREEATQTMLSLVEGKIDKEAMEKWIVAHSLPRSSLELREFLRDVDFNKLFRFAMAFSAGSEAERRATVNEVIQDIPVVEQFLFAAEKAREESHEGIAGELFGHAFCLIALYRLAEEMGYEW